MLSRRSSRRRITTTTPTWATLAAVVCAATTWSMLPLARAFVRPVIVSPAATAAARLSRTSSFCAAAEKNSPDARLLRRRRHDSHAVTPRRPCSHPHRVGGLRSSVALRASEVGIETDPGVVAGLEIVKYPHPALRAASVEVPEAEFAAAESLARRMLELMYEAEGVGLAAPQVGVNKRLMVFNPEGKKEKWLDEVVFVNPRIVATSDGRDVAPEGCLSFPGMQGDVERHKWIKVEGVTPKGRKLKKKYSGWVARIFQHEYDHLEGVVYVDRLSETGRAEIQPKLDELVAGFDGEHKAL